MRQLQNPKFLVVNVDGLTRAYEGVGDVLEDDDFPDATIMTINVEEYQKIIQYLDGIRFLLEPQRWCEHELCTRVELLNNRRPTLFPRKGWCFATNHWKR
jgi:hypothetical protein